MNDNEVLITAWWISLFTSVPGKSTSWSTLLFRPCRVFSLTEFKSCSCCQTTFVGVIHYFALPFRILRFSREFATVVCQVLSSSVFLIFLSITDLGLLEEVSAFCKTVKGPGEHHLLSPGHDPCVVQGKPSCFPALRCLHRQSRWDGWEGRWLGVPVVFAGPDSTHDTWGHVSGVLGLSF